MWVPISRKNANKTKICFCSGYNELLGKTVTMVTSGTVSCTMEQVATKRRDASFKRNERRKRAKARAKAASGQMEKRCPPSQHEGLHTEEKQLQKSVRRANRRGRHRLLIERRKVEQGLLSLVNQQGGTRQDPKTRSVGLHSLLATATLYGTHTPLTKTVARAQSNRESEQTEAQGVKPAQQWVAVDSQDPPTVPSTQRSQEDGILLIVPA